MSALQNRMCASQVILRTKVSLLPSES
uniref:Uncharacterized protein n=1 Tax=Rhizophora mucronata TaxID=61149 RepID=A0A2P2QV18_RHIMU